MNIKKTLLALMLPCMLLATTACKEEVHSSQIPPADTATQIFLEGGQMVDANRIFEEEDLRDALIHNIWNFSYAFFYDKNKAGGRLEQAYFDSFSYTFKADGTATSKQMTYGTVTNFQYTVNNRTVTLTNESQTLSFVVVSLDPGRMVVDEAVENIVDYDEATVKRRIVFKAKP